MDSKLENYMGKLGSEVEICWKSETIGNVFLNNFLMLSIFLRQVYFFLKLKK